MSNGSAVKITPSQDKDKKTPIRKAKISEPPQEEATVPSDFASAIYDAFTKVFGNQNPSQMFSLCWPGTVLDYEELGWDKDSGEATVPPTQNIRIAQLLDQYVPPSPITQPDGTRVSDRYKMAISQLAPVPNEHLNKLQTILRERINIKVQVEIDGKEKEMKLVDYFYYLFSNWIRAKEDWSRRQQEAIERFENKFPNDPSAQYNAYIKWYETNADSWIEKIHAAYYEMLAQFPLTQWNDAIAILDTKDDAGLNEAKQLLNSATIPVPPNEGFSYVPTRGQPLFWTTQLKPTTGFIDFLSDPELQKATLETALLRLEDELMAWRAIIPQVDDKAIQELADNLAAKSKKWREDQKNLRDVYTANAVTAVEIFIDIYSSRGKKLDEADEQEGQKITEDVNNLTEALNQENGQPGDELDWEKIKEAAKKIGEGQDSLNAAQSEMIESGLDLATAATEFLKNKGPKSGFTWLESYISQLETCCARAQEQLKNFSSSANNYYKYLSAVEPEQGKNPNFSPSFGDTAYPSPTSDANASTWTEIKISIDQKQMESTRSLSTFFSELDWGVNLFLGSASGSNVESSTEFAEEFMSAESKIEMGFLAQKILIKREWMKPELFLHTGNMVRVLDKPLSPADPVNIKEISKYSNQDKLLELLSKNSFPSYPVALVVVKDLCVKVTLDASKTKALRDTWDSKKTAGGGLFCFSVSESRAESSENESLSSYAMAGQMILRAPAPQIIGYFVQMLPPDKSTPLTEARVKEIGQAIGFVQDLAMAHRTDPLPKMIKAPAGVN